jgi:hypothetical protein
LFPIVFFRSDLIVCSKKKTSRLDPSLESSVATNKHLLDQVWHRSLLQKKNIQRASIAHAPTRGGRQGSSARALA